VKRIILTALVASAGLAASLVVGAPAATAVAPASVSSAVSACPPVVGYGYTTKGWAVSRLQRELNEEMDRVGSAGTRLQVDGIFGRLTYETLINIQMGLGQLADGIAGRQTWHALGVC